MTTEILQELRDDFVEIRNRVDGGIEMIDAYLSSQAPKPAFEFVIKTDVTHKQNASEDNQFFFGVTGEGYDCEFDWDDGVVEYLTDDDVVEIEGKRGFLHTYEEPGTYSIRARGTIPRVINGRGYDSLKWVEVRSWASLHLDSADNMMTNTRRVQIVGDALANCFNVAPGRKTLRQTFQQCGSHRYPDLTAVTEGVEYFDRVFYLANVKVIPNMNTESAKGFHNMYRSAKRTEVLPDNMVSPNVEFQNRTFRNAGPNITTEDIEELGLSYDELRACEGMFADLPGVTRPPSNLSFAKNGLPFSDGKDKMFGHSIDEGANLMFAGETHELGVSQKGAPSGLETLGEQNFIGLKSARWFCYKCLRLKEVLDYEFPDLDRAYMMFAASGIQRAENLVFSSPTMVEGNRMFADCLDLEHITGIWLENGAFFEIAVRCPNLKRFEASVGPNARFFSPFEGCTNLERVILNGYKAHDLGVRDLSLNYQAILDLIESLGVVESGTKNILVSGNPGTPELTDSDITWALSKGWKIKTE